MAQVNIKFPTDGDAQAFADWLSDQGEQYFFQYQEVVEADAPEHDPIVEFKYKGMKGGIINVTGKA